MRSKVSTLKAENSTKNYTGSPAGTKRCVIVKDFTKEFLKMLKSLAVDEGVDKFWSFYGANKFPWLTTGQTKRSRPGPVYDQLESIVS
jgi:hypothetical protein